MAGKFNRQEQRRLEKIIGKNASMVKLLRVLRPPTGHTLCCREFKRLGDTKNRISDVRIIAVTNRNLLDLVETDGFREDLYYRVASVMPPLGGRTTALLKEINEEFTKTDPQHKHKIICDSTKKIMTDCHWPGNVREFKNILLQASVMAEKEKLTGEDIKAVMSESRCNIKSQAMTGAKIPEEFNLEGHLEEIRTHHLKKAWEESGHNIEKGLHMLDFNNYQTFDNQLIK